MEAKSETELLQHKTHFERAISWARLNAASVAAGFFFATMIIIFLVSPRHPRPLRYERGLYTQPLPSCSNLWLPSIVFFCALSRKFNVHLAKIICLNHKLLSKIVFEQNWLRMYFWDTRLGRNLWDEWDQHYMKNIFLIYLFSIFNINICIMYVSFGFFTMWYKGKGGRSGSTSFSPQSSPPQCCRRWRRNRSGHHRLLHEPLRLECVRLP